MNRMGPAGDPALHGDTVVLQSRGSSPLSLCAKGLSVCHVSVPWHERASPSPTTMSPRPVQLPSPVPPTPDPAPHHMSTALNMAFSSFRLLKSRSCRCSVLSWDSWAAFQGLSPCPKNTCRVVEGIAGFTGRATLATPRNAGALV